MKTIRKKWHLKKIWAVGGTAAVLVFIIDQITKWLAAAYQAGQPPTVVIPGFFRFAYTTNPGAAWGIFADHTALLALISFFIMLILIWRFPAMTEGLPERVAGLGVLLGGVAGNLFDRVIRGEVVDFIDLHLYGYHWPTFNVADSAICIGIAFYIFSMLIRGSNQSGNEQETKTQ